MQSSKVRRDKLTLSIPHKPTPARQEYQEGILDTKNLFKGTRELRIKHNSETYRLTITKLGKLILTK
jgi:hemin uptake protein HemP